MDLKFYRSSSSERPAEIDANSSNTVVYICKNIREVEKVDEMTKEPYIVYEYDECKLTKDEFKMYQIEQNTESELDDIKLAIADLASALIE